MTLRLDGPDGLYIEVPDGTKAKRAVNGTWLVNAPAPVPILGRSLSDCGVNRDGRSEFSLEEWEGYSARSVGDTMVQASPAQLQGAPGASWNRASYWSVPGRSSIDSMQAYVFVGWNPEVAGECFAPAMGDGQIARFLRSVPISTLRVNFTKLPSVIDMSKLPNVMPIDYYERLFASFCGDIYAGWSTDTRTPDLQHPGYGTYLASVVSQALVWLCSTEHPAMKARLATAMAAWGLDLAGAYADGRNCGSANGGHMLGRKALVMLAGYLLDAAPLTDPNTYVGKVFAEDDAFYRTEWWESHLQPSGWRRNSGDDFLKKHPSTWTADQYGEKWRWHYVDQVVGSEIGTALAMQLMGLAPQFGFDCWQMCQNWMEKPKPIAITGHPEDVAWGEDYSVGGGAGMCAAAWRQVNQRP